MIAVTLVYRRRTQCIRLSLDCCDYIFFVEYTTAYEYLSPIEIRNVDAEF